MHFFPVPPSSGIFSLCQDWLSSDASELGTALLCSSKASSVYVAVSRNSIVHQDWGRTIGACWLRCSGNLLSRLRVRTLYLCLVRSYLLLGGIATIRLSLSSPSLYQPLPGFKLGSPRPRSNKLDRSAMGRALMIVFIFPTFYNTFYFSFGRALMNLSLLKDNYRSRYFVVV